MRWLLLFYIALAIFDCKAEDFRRRPGGSHGRRWGCDRDRLEEVGPEFSVDPWEQIVPPKKGDRENSRINVGKQAESPNADDDDDDSIKTLPTDAAEILTKIVSANRNFTANVYKELIQAQQGSIICSGLSAEIVLSLLADGAQGETQQQLLTALGLPNDQAARDAAFKQLTTDLAKNSENLKLLSANKLFPADGFAINETFKNISVDVYRSNVENEDYTNAEAAANNINKWVESQTNNKIQNLIDPTQLSAATVLVLVNALYFSGNWTHAFDSSNTANRSFSISETESINTLMMYSEITANFLHSSELQARFLQLDFKDGNVSMNFILPDSISGLGAVENNLEAYLQPQKLTTTKIGITLPKFTLNTQIDFTSILQKLGVTTVFTDQADLSKISSAGLKVSFVVQKAFIEVGETGVEAAAATAGGIELRSGVLELEPVDYFNATHPFLFNIVDKNSGLIFFAGKYMGSK